MTILEPSHRRAILVVFLVLASLLIVSRWTLRHEPLDRDISAYAVIGREMLEGRPLYGDLWDHKPPGIHLIFAVATAIVGPGVPAVLAINIVCSLALLVGFMVGGKRLAGSPGAVFAGTIWLTVGGDLGLQANQPNAEMPVNALVTWALVLSFGRNDERSHPPPWVFGAMAGAAIAIKPIAAPIFAGILLVDLVETRRRRGPGAASVDLLRWIAAATVIPATLIGWCVARVGVEPAWEALVVYNSGYGPGNPASNLLGLTRVAKHLPGASLSWIAILVASSIPGLASLSKTQRNRVLAVLAGGLIAVAAPGRFYPHYYQLIVPPLCLAAAAGLAYGWRHRAGSKVAACSVVAVLAVGQIWNHRLSPEEWSLGKYGVEFVEEKQLAQILCDRLEPGDGLWVLAPYPGLYLQTGTRPTSGVVYDYPLMRRSPILKQLSDRVLTDLKADPPELLVLRSKRGNRRIVRWVRANYIVLDGLSPSERLEVWIRKDAGSMASGG